MPNKATLTLLFISLFFLSACTQTGSMVSSEENPGAVLEKTAIRKKPRIPQITDVTETNDKKGDEVQKLLEEIETNIHISAITSEDIKRGWYYGGVNEKKPGTPDSWQWFDDGKNSIWVSPNMDPAKHEKAKELCHGTGGLYVISCIESDVADCEYIPTSICECKEGSKWHEEQGCLLIDEKEEFIEIGTHELSQGWYWGLQSQKKLNTPKKWVWVEAGRSSRWQNPSPK